jgi:phospholipid/cholesterol/gamma-HCH transport system substrate-binding protein
MSRLSRTVASRDEELGRLLESSALLTGTLDGSREDVAALLRDAAVLLEELDRRREAVSGLIVHTRELAVQVRGLVRDNEEQIGPALAALGEVADQLESRQRDLRATVRGVVKFARVFVNTIGGGPWFDSYIGNAPDNLEIEEDR